MRSIYSLLVGLFLCFSGLQINECQAQSAPSTFEQFFNLLPDDEAGLPDLGETDRGSLLTTLKQGKQSNGNYVFEGESREGDIFSTWFHFFENEKSQAKSVLALEVSDGQSSTLSVWKYDPGSAKLVSAENLTPKVKPQMFLAESARASTSGMQTNFTLIEGGDKITAFLSSRIGSDFEENDLAFNVDLIWNGRKFEVKRTARNN